MTKRRRATRAQEEVLDRLEYLVLRDHGHEWALMRPEGSPFHTDICRNCGRWKVVYLRGSRTSSAHGESGCVYTDT